MPGVVGVPRAQFWCHTPKELVGSVVLMTAQGADRTAVMAAARGVFAAAGVAHMTVQVEEDRSTMAALSAPGAAGRGLHSTTFQLNLSAVYGIGGARRVV